MVISQLVIQRAWLERTKEKEEKKSQAGQANLSQFRPFFPLPKYRGRGNFNRDRHRGHHHRDRHRLNAKQLRRVNEKMKTATLTSNLILLDLGFRRSRNHKHRKL